MTTQTTTQTQTQIDYANTNANTNTNDYANANDCVRRKYSCSEHEIRHCKRCGSFVQADETKQLGKLLCSTTISGLYGIDNRITSVAVDLTGSAFSAIQRIRSGQPAREVVVHALSDTLEALARGFISPFVESSGTFSGAVLEYVTKVRLQVGIHGFITPRLAEILSIDLTARQVEEAIVPEIQVSKTEAVKTIGLFRFSGSDVTPSRFSRKNLPVWISVLCYIISRCDYVWCGCQLDPCKSHRECRTIIWVIYIPTKSNCSSTNLFTIDFMSFGKCRESDYVSYFWRIVESVVQGTSGCW